MGQKLARDPGFARPMLVSTLSQIPSIDSCTRDIVRSYSDATALVTELVLITEFPYGDIQ